jgi:hypothetical protein
MTTDNSFKGTAPGFKKAAGSLHHDITIIRGLIFIRHDF